MEGNTMAAEPEAGTVTAQQAMLLLLLDKPADREGAFSQMAQGRYWLKDLVQGFARHVRKTDAPALVSSAALARHFDCVPAYIRKLVEQGVIERRSDGKFDQDQCRAKYLAHLRAERQRSPKSAADTEFTGAKTALIRLRVEEKQRTLVRQDQVDALIDDMMGVILPALASMPGRCAPRGDLATRRNIERVMFEVRTKIANVCQEMADKHSEPTLDEQ
jgi:hypothetical protein